MLRHMVLFRFRPDISGAERDEVLDGLARLPSLVPAMRRFGLGENVSRRDQTFTHAMAVEFEDRRALDRYLGSPLHEGFVSGTFRPAIEDRAIASFEQPPAGPRGGPRARGPVAGRADGEGNH